MERVMQASTYDDHQQYRYQPPIPNSNDAALDFPPVPIHSPNQVSVCTTTADQTSFFVQQNGGRVRRKKVSGLNPVFARYWLKLNGMYSLSKKKDKMQYRHAVHNLPRTWTTLRVQVSFSYLSLPTSRRQQSLFWLIFKIAEEWRVQQLQISWNSINDAVGTTSLRRNFINLANYTGSISKAKCESSTQFGQIWHLAIFSKILKVWTILWVKPDQLSQGV